MSKKKQKKQVKPLWISTRMLRILGACRGGIDFVERHWGDGFFLTKANAKIIAARDCGYILWLSRKIASRKEHDSIMTASDREYLRKACNAFLAPGARNRLKKSIIRAAELVALFV